MKQDLKKTSQVSWPEKYLQKCSKTFAVHFNIFENRVIKEHFDFSTPSWDYLYRLKVKYQDKDLEKEFLFVDFMTAFTRSRWKLLKLWQKYVHYQQNVCKCPFMSNKTLHCAVRVSHSLSDEMSSTPLFSPQIYSIKDLLLFAWLEEISAYFCKKQKTAVEEESEWDVRILAKHQLLSFEGQNPLWIPEWQQIATWKWEA